MSEQEAPCGNEMNEALAYEWAAQTLRGLGNKLVASDLQTMANRISSAILQAYQKGNNQPLPQTLPTPGHEPVTPRLREILLPLLKQREQEGIATYGRPLETFNNRSAWTDLSQELIDAMQYGMQLEMERRALAEWLKEALTLAEDMMALWLGSEKYGFPERLAALQEKTNKVI